MTKYEWERELKRHIAVLPKNEQARIFDYYSEIFEDRIEAGMQEKDIIYEFGNPFDVAQKILSDYRYEDYETVRPPRFRPDRPERDEKKAEPFSKANPPRLPIPRRKRRPARRRISAKARRAKKRVPRGNSADSFSCWSYTSFWEFPSSRSS